MAFRPISLAFALGLGLFPLFPALAGPPPVAGLAPDRRPPGAPVLTQGPSQEALAKGMHGISRPLPPGLGFIASQGAWHTPFTRPGMTGPYDLRGWHTESAKR